MISRPVTTYGRLCLECASTTTYINKKGKETWYGNPRRYICSRCRHKLIDNPKHNPKNTPRRLTFKGKIILLESNPRKGQCSQCGNKIGDKFVNKFGENTIVKKTHMHHVEYHEDDPLRDTIELCAQCHKKEHWRLKKERENK